VSVRCAPNFSSHQHKTIADSGDLGLAVHGGALGKSAHRTDFGKTRAELVRSNLGGAKEISLHRPLTISAQHLR